MAHPGLRFDIVSVSQNTAKNTTDWVTLAIVPQALAPQESIHWGGEKIGIEQLSETPDGVLYRLRSSAPIIARSALQIIYNYSVEPLAVPTRKPFCSTMQGQTALPGGQFEQVWVTGEIDADSRLTLDPGGPIEFEILRPYDRTQFTALIKTTRPQPIMGGVIWYIAID